MFEKKKFYKQQPKYQHTLSWWESASSTITNLKYAAQKTINQFFQSPQNLELKQIIIQGKRYKNRQQAKQIVNKILWFSYRKGFNIKNQYKSDVGWGCLVRVGQMALGSALLNYFNSQDQRSGFVNYDDTVSNLIAAFSDVQGQQQKYSLNNIIQVAHQQFQQKPGQWFDLSKISLCLRILQNKHPMRGSSGLKVVAFDQCINIPTIFKIQKLQLCRCAKKTVVCEKCHSQSLQKIQCPKHIKIRNGKFQSIHQTTRNDRADQYLDNTKNKQYSTSHQVKGIKRINNSNNSSKSLSIFRNGLLNKDLILFVLTRVGDPHHIQKVNQAVFSLLDLSICMGIMTGFPNLAIFVVGRQNNRLIYLNPHYVQQNDSLRQVGKKDSYFCKQYLLCQRTQLDPSMAFCFYIQNLNQLQLLVHTVNNVHYKYPDSLSLGIDFDQAYFNHNDYIQQDDDDNFSVMSFQSTFKM